MRWKEMALCSYWNKSWPAHISGKRNTTPQYFLIAIDLLSCSVWRALSVGPHTLLLYLHVHVVLWLCMCIVKFIGVYATFETLVIFWQAWQGAPLRGPKQTHSVTLALCSIIFTLGQSVLHYFLCSICLPPLFPPPLFTSLHLSHTLDVLYMGLAWL